MKNNLNKQQTEAVNNTLGPSIILAGAGSGKTKVLVSKVLYLVDKVKLSPESILMITFTNKAAKEMQNRIQNQNISGRNNIGFIGTFHSFCVRILRQYGHNIGLDANFSIYDVDDQATIIRGILKKNEVNKFTPSFFLNRISYAKNQLIGPEKYLEAFGDYSASQVSEVYYQYYKQLKNHMAVDFDDLIFKSTELFRQFPEVLLYFQDKYTHIMIDEFQDTNFAQYVFARQLGKKYGNLTVVGDFSQSIYSWRGADIKNLDKFKDDFYGTKTFFLEQNYRSTQQILDFAYSIISQNQSHPVLKLFTENEVGESIVQYETNNEESEAQYIVDTIRSIKRENPDASFAVLYRINAQSRVIEEALLHSAMPYTLIGGTRFYERKEVKDVLAFLRLLVNPHDELAQDRIKKIGKRFWEKYKTFYKKYQDKSAQCDTIQIMELALNETGYLQMYDVKDEEDNARLENIKELKSVALNHNNLTDFLHQVMLVESEYFDGEKREGGNNLKLMTLHQAKGLEFPYVFIVGVEEGILPHSRSIDDIFQLEEERRLFYVGITRAEKRLYITYTKRRFMFGKRTETIKSRFLESNEVESIPDITEYW
ncbi:MAG: UvrD-helicase domain-containing protein [Candidatus Roizmanbacteria bacterium]